MGLSHQSFTLAMRVDSAGTDSTSITSLQSSEATLRSRRSTRLLHLSLSTSKNHGQHSLKYNHFIMEFLQKFIDNSYDYGSQDSCLVKRKVNCDAHSMYHTAVGELLWMSQLRDNIKYLALLIQTFQT